MHMHNIFLSNLQKKINAKTAAINEDEEFSTFLFFWPRVLKDPFADLLKRSAIKDVRTHKEGRWEKDRRILSWTRGPIGPDG